jgi:hypothetical protein
MKLLMFYGHEWWYRTAAKSLDDAPEMEKEEATREAVVIFFHSEAEDVDKRDGVLKKFIKNTKWIAGKFGTKNVVLHSFNHLGQSKAPAEFAQSLLNDVVSRLEHVGFSVMVTPFGYFNEFRMHVDGASLAKVFKEF